MSSSWRWLFILICYGSLVYAQTQGSTSATAAKSATDIEESDGITRAEPSVPIAQTPSDTQIADRLRGILDVTRWVKNLRVSSHDGVVTVSGEVQKQAQSDWIENLIRDTTGVVAVINDIQVRAKPLLDLAPARAETEGLAKRAVGFLPYFLSAMILMAVFLGLSFVASHLGRKMAARRFENPLMIETVAKLAAVPIILLGLYLVLRTSGLTGMAVTIMGGTGALGLIMGFAMQNILANYFAGIMLSLRNPFTVGDTVILEGHTGVVQKLTTRGTVLIDFDGNHIIVPNSKIYGNTIVNQSSNPSARISFRLNVGYSADLPRVRALIADVLKTTPEVLAKPEFMVVTDKFVMSGAELVAYFWIDGVKSSALKVKSKVMELVKQKLERAGIEFPGAERRQWVEGERSARTDQASAPRAENAPTQSEVHGLIREAERGRDIDHGHRLL